MNLTKEEKKELYTCISCRLSIIETGDYSMRAKDATKQGKHDKVKALSIEQMKLIILLDDLMVRLLDDL